MMFAKRPYQRLRAVEYARKWALSRNPLFQNFAGIGGDCTSFVSQCLLAGSCVMNETPDYGWYFRAPGNYAPAWSGVEFLYRFLISNMESGPFGEEVPVTAAELGDIVQLGTREGKFYHSLMLTGVSDGVFTVCAHNNDALDRRLDSYMFERARFLHIDGVRFVIPAYDCCYKGLLAGESVFPTEAQRRVLSCIPAASAEDVPGNAPGNVPVPVMPITQPSEVPPTEGVQRPADILPPDFTPETGDIGGVGDIPPV